MADNNDNDARSLAEMTIDEIRQEMMVANHDHYQQMTEMEEGLEENREEFNNIVASIKEEHNDVVGLYALQHPEEFENFHHWLKMQALEAGMSVELSQGRLTVIGGN